jgi:hypothetical protein
MINIIGAGMAGLLAGSMLGTPRGIRILERQSTLPNNHNAVLRFRSEAVAEATGIKFKRVSMIKCSQPWRNPVADALSYSKKATGTYRSDRSITSGTVAEDRFIAPPNFISQLAERSAGDIMFDHEWVPDGTPTISTIPMPDLMMILDYPIEEDFTSIPGTTYKATILNCDAYVSVLVPDPSFPFTRISITGDELMIECPGIQGDALTLPMACQLMGIPAIDVIHPSSYEAKYFKITPVDDDARKNFMYWATDKHNIYSLGRFATWRPSVLLDDVVKDIRLIDEWMGRKYEMARVR